MKLLGIRLLMICMALPGLAGEQCLSYYDDNLQIQPPYSFQVYESSHTLSQRIRDNHLDYSYFVKEYEASLSLKHHDLSETLKKLISHKGWISGDNHVGNYIIGPINGSLKYYFADIKDGGYGPLFYNFVNIVLNTHAVAKRKKVAKVSDIISFLTKFYIQGLKNEIQSPPEIIKQELEISMAEYEQLLNKDVRKYTSKKNKFKFKKENINELEVTEENEKIKKHLAEVLLKTGKVKSVLDYAMRLKERGGSKNLKRYWVLVENENSEKRIIEFKEINIPAAQAYESSGLNLKAHTEQMMAIYYPEKDPLIQVININNKAFLMRPKKVDLISVPYKIESFLELNALLDLASYAVYTTGVKHSKSFSSSQYIALVENESDNVQKLLRQIVKDYYQHLKVKSLESQAVIDSEFEL